MQKIPVTIDIVLHPTQTQIIQAMREGEELEWHTLRSLAERIRDKTNLRQEPESPQRIKHHLQQLVKLGVVNIIDGKYINNDTYGQRMANKYNKLK